MGVTEIIGVLGGLIAIGAVVLSAGRFVESVKMNTKVTEKLGEMIDGHLKWSVEIVREHDERFHEHDRRITVLEETRPRK